MLPAHASTHSSTPHGQPRESPAVPPTLDGVRKIALLRANGVGDFLFALPALEALRCAYPDAEIVLLALDWHRAFLAGRPGPVDRVVVVPPSRGVRDDPGAPEQSPALDAFFEEMGRETFDLAIQAHGGGRYSNPFVRRLGARLSVGLQAENAVAPRWKRFAAPPCPCSAARGRHRFGVRTSERTRERGTDGYAKDGSAAGGGRRHPLQQDVAGNAAKPFRRDCQLGGRAAAGRRPDVVWSP